MSMDIKQLEADVADLQTRLQAAKEKLHAARVEASGIGIGDVVRDVRDAREIRVTKVDTSFRGKPWVFGNPRRKDGTFGISVRCLYSHWENVP